jgi:hypothetical protein
MFGIGNCKLGGRQGKTVRWLAFRHRKKYVWNYSGFLEFHPKALSREPV